MLVHADSHHDNGKEYASEIRDDIPPTVVSHTDVVSPSAKVQANTGLLLLPVMTYEDLGNHYSSWYEGRTKILLVVGAPGLGKSFLYEQILQGEDYHLFRGTASAFDIYRTVRDEPEWPVVFDDLGDLFTKRPTVELVKSLCDSRPVRRVQWRTAALDPE